MKTYNVANDLHPHGKWITEEEWKSAVMREYDQIMKHQEVSSYGIDEDGNKYQMGIELKTTIEKG